MRKEDWVHHGVEIRCDNASHRIPLSELADGRSITVYGQQEVVKDLVALREQAQAPLYFDAEVEAIEDLTSDVAHVRANGVEGPLESRCDYVLGCDGSFGISNKSIPVACCVATSGPIRSRGSGSSPKRHGDRGVDLLPTREGLRALLDAFTDTQSSCTSRDPGGNPREWPDERIWEELNIRLATDEAPEVHEGPIVRARHHRHAQHRGRTNALRTPSARGRRGAYRSATGAKGMNLALADIRVLSRALVDQLVHGDGRGLEDYSATCLERVWRAEEFSNYMTQMLHPTYDDEFENGVQMARLRQAVNSARPRPCWLVITLT